MELLALDFDGVISDSAPEAWLVTLRTYAALRPVEAIAGLLARAEGQSPDEIRVDAAYRRFVAMMPLGNRAEDFAVALSLVAGDRDAPDQAAFDRVFAAEPGEFLRSFHERFYHVRTALREGDPERWVSLIGPYPEFLATVRRCAQAVRLAIATAKDRASVEQLLERYGIADLFAPETLLDKDAGRSKRGHLERLHARLGVPYPEIVFVDDKVNHLDDVSGMGVRGVLAAWGYNGERERRQARERGYIVCTLDDFERVLFGGQRGDAGLDSVSRPPRSGRTS